MESEYYFKYTRTLEFFENDELFYKIDYTNFMDFLLAIQGKKNITKILYVGHNYDDIEKLLNFSISLPTNIKIFIIICGDWWYWDFYPESQKFVTKNIFYYDNIKYIVCTDYKTLGSFLNINLDNFQQNIISFDMHSCYDKCIIPFNNSPINKILVSGDCHQDWYPERHYLLKFNN